MDTQQTIVPPIIPPPVLPPPFVTPPTPEHNNNKALYIVLGILVGLAIAVVVIWQLGLVRPNLVSIPLPTTNTAEDSYVATNQSTKITPPLPSAPVQSPIKDCGTDIQCFIGAAINGCQLSKVNYFVNGPHPFVALAYPDLSTVTANTYYEIKGQEGVNCVIYQKLLSGLMTYDQNKLAQITAGKPQVTAQAQAILDSTNEGYKLFVGKDGTCKVTGQEFAGKINDSDITKGNFSFSTDDPYVAKCSGPLFLVQVQ